jgi:hypothetical protein
MGVTGPFPAPEFSVDLPAVARSLPFHPPSD